MAARPESDIQSVMRHYDGQIASLNNEVSGIKGVLSEHGSILNEIRGALGDLKVRQGPGMGSMMKVLVAGGALIAMSAGAITVLVTSFVAPDITKLMTEGVANSRYIQHQEQSDRKELADFRRKSADRLEQRLEMLAGAINELGRKQAWSPTVSTKRN